MKRSNQNLTNSPILEKDESVSDASFSQCLRLASMADNTRRAYAKGWQCFSEYCDRNDIASLEAAPEQVANFFIELATRKSPRTGKYLSLGTLILYRSAIRKRYEDAGDVSPTHHADVADVLKGLARIRGTAQRQVNALREGHIAAMLEQCPNTTIGRRDAAVLAIGFAAAMRRSELCCLKLGDIKRMKADANKDGAGIIIHIRRSKTDQSGTGQRIAVPEGKHIRPVSVLERWINAAGLAGVGHDQEPLFQTLRRGGKRTGRPLHHSDIPRLVKHYVASIGLDPAEFSAHSLRAGFVTSAAAHHARLDKIMAITRHTNPATVMKYIRDADAFANHAGEGFL